LLGNLFGFHNFLLAIFIFVYMFYFRFHDNLLIIYFLAFVLDVLTSDAKNSSSLE
jgi:hypothetical protein